MKNQEPNSKPTDSKQRSGKGLLSTDLFAHCEGRCGSFGSCYGEILPCNVFTPSKSRKWGTYGYCTNAQRKTVKAGYVVEVVCGTCDGSGVVDSGGVLPWGESAMRECPECESRRANDRDVGRDECAASKPSTD